MGRSKSAAASTAQAAPLAEHPHFTKLDGQCKPLPRSAKEHAAVYDARTGLIWAVRVVRADTHAEAVDLAKAHASVNSHDDWRLGERDECASILDLTKFNPASDEEFFPDTPARWHWTNTAYAPSPAGYAWGVGFSSGFVGNNDRDYDGFVRAVRGPVAARPGQ